VKVWRLEDGHGHGFYQAVNERMGMLTEEADSYVEAAVSGPGPWPVPEADGISPFLVLLTNMRFGFASVESMLSWFGSNVEALSRSGVCVSVYDVPEDRVVKGGHQVAFLPDGARLVSVSSLEDFFKSEGVKDASVV
jgi:hypothetical protein